MKEWKKVLATLLCGIMLVSAMTGCGETPDTGASSSEEEVSSQITDVESTGGEDIQDSSESIESTKEEVSTVSKVETQRPAGTSSTKAPTNKVNLKGREILIKSVIDQAFGVWVDPIDPEDETEEQKILREWRENFEKTYNCKIKLQAVAPNDTQNQMIVKMLSGDKFADLISGQRVDFERIRKAGNLLTDLKTVKTLNLSSAGINKGITGAYLYNNKQLGMVIGYGSVAQNGFIVNNSILKKLKGVEDPYKQAKEGKWTFDAFFKLVKAATQDNGNGTWDLQDQYGVSWSDITNVAFFKAAGVDILKPNSKGKMEYVMNNAKFRTVADQLITNLVDTNVMFINGNLTMALRQFSAGKILLLAQPSYHAGTILATADIDLGWLPIPTYNGGTNYTNIADGWTGALMIPAAASTADKEAVGYLLNEYAKLNEKGGKYRKAVQEDYQNNFFANCPECWDLFENALNNWTVDYYFPELGNQIPWSIMHKVTAGDADYINNLESFNDEFVAWVDDTFNS